MEKKRFIFVFLGTTVLLFTLFYFYPAEIFECKIIGDSSELVIDLSLKSIFFNGDLPSNLNPENINSINPTVSGWLILFIIIIGLPIMFAYRSVVNRPERSDDKIEE